MQLTQSQREASEHFKGPALTLAIPGSGKTTLLLHRLIYLVEEEKVAPENILTLTFSKSSADDMQARFRDTFKTVPYHFTFMTIHKFAYGILKQYMKHTGNSLTLLTQYAERYAILSGIYQKYYHSPLSEEDYETLSNEFGLIYNLQLKEKATEGHSFSFDSIFSMIKDFHTYKKEHHLIDFDDMLVYAIQILKKNPKVLAFYRKQYPFIQVDEAQDTSKLQYTLIEMLATHLFLVADDDQSIYGFRGAYPEYLLDFPQKYPEAKLYYLKDNFRSNANIVYCSKAIIENNSVRFDKPMEAFHDPTSKPRLITFDDLVDRNDYLLDQIRSSEGTQAILYRNRASSLSLIDLLDRENIDFYIKEAPVAELNHFMINDITHFMLLAMMPQDVESFKRIAFKMNGYISREMVNYISERIISRNIFDILADAPFMADYQSRTQEKLKAQFDDLSRLRPYDAIHFIESELGYLDYLNKNKDRLGYTMNFARTRLDAYKAIARYTKSTFDFINRIETLKANLSLMDASDKSKRVTLSTIHSSKGLEFDRVYMVDVNDQVFPSPDPDLLEEERRLFYVGLTRAKSDFELLHIAFVGGGQNKTSKFVKEFLLQDVLDDRMGHA